MQKFIKYGTFTIVKLNYVYQKVQTMNIPINNIYLTGMESWWHDIVWKISLSYSGIKVTFLRNSLSLQCDLYASPAAWSVIMSTAI